MVYVWFVCVCFFFLVIRSSEMFDCVFQKSDTRQKTVACYTRVKKWEFVEHENTYIIPFPPPFFLFFF